MGKTKRSVPSCDKRKNSTLPLDTISEDGILCLIVSSLPLRDAVRTSVLSHRWRHIWTQRPNLHFNAGNVFDPLTLRSLQLHGTRKRIQLLIEKTDQFIASVNTVLQHHQGNTKIEKFSLKYFLTNSYSHHLDAWIKFVVASKIKRLFLNLQQDGNDSFDDHPYLYNFPFQLLGLSHIEHLTLSCCSLNPAEGFDGLRCLKFLWLDRVDITEQDVGRLLSNCFTLESLIVEDCPELVTLSIPQHLSRLKHVSVLQWVWYTDEPFKKIEINAENLITLEYYGNPVDFILRKSSRLRSATISFLTNVDIDLTKLAKDFRCIKYLKLHLVSKSKVVAYLGNNSNRFINLRHLELNYVEKLGNSRGCQYLTSLLSAAPFMEKFTLNYSWSHKFSLRRVYSTQIKLRKRFLHTHLKMVEIKGFTGDKWQIIFAVHLLKSAIELESMTLRKKDSFHVDKRLGKVFEKNMWCLTREVPANVKLLVL